jgi:hypothetical protein
MNKAFSKYKKASWLQIAISDPHKERNFKSIFLTFSGLDPLMFESWLNEVSRHHGVKWHKVKAGFLILTTANKILKGNGE